MLTRRLREYHTLLDAITDAPPNGPFATLWNPRRDPALEHITFGVFLERAAGYARGYQSRGLHPRDTVVLIADQSLDLLAAFVGALLAGVIPAILPYPTFKVDPDKYAHGLSGVTANLRAPLVTVDQSFPASYMEHIRGFPVVTLPDLYRGGGTFDAPRARPAPEDVAFIQHSAGTTGLQKGVALSHRAVLAQLAALSGALQVRETDHVVSWLPLYHDMGLIACLVLPLAAHLPLTMQSPTDWVLWPDSFLRLASDRRATLCWLPNFAFQFLARRVSPAQRRDLNLSALRAVVNCSEPVRAESMTEFARAYHTCGLSPSALQTSYAMAENTFAVTQSAWPESFTPLWVDRQILADHGRIAVARPDDPRARPILSSGRPLPDTRIRVVGEDDRETPAGTAGELLVQSKSMFDGYYRRPDLTTGVLRDGWYRTGDTGLMWNDDLYVLGRKDDVIIVGGRNLYPQDVEEAAAGNARVRDGRVVAFGIDNPRLGTQDLAVVAEVNTEEDLARQAEIQADIRRRVIAEVDVAPRLIHLVPPEWIVKSTAGKAARSTTRRRVLRHYPELASPP